MAEKIASQILAILMVKTLGSLMDIATGRHPARPGGLPRDCCRILERASLPFLKGIYQCFVWQMLKNPDFRALILIRVKSAWNFRVVFMYVIMHLDQL